jgi:COP9 signalosome complex subunit 1
MQTSGLETVRNYEREALGRVRRMSIAAADLEVRGNKRGAHGAGIPHMNEMWYDSAGRPGFPAPSEDD